MSADGTWMLSMRTPRGERKSTLVLRSAGDALAGTLTGEGGKSSDILDGKADGGSVFFRAAIASPTPMTLEFAGTIGGNEICGTVTAGAFGTWPFTARRA